jgi:FkbM family methyltransferase
MKSMKDVLIKTAFLINKFGLEKLLFSRAKRFSRTYGNLIFLANNAKNLSWKGKNLFVLNDLDVSFQLEGPGIGQVEKYFEIKDRIRFKQHGDDFYAYVSGLKILLPFPSGVIELKDTFLNEEYSFFDLKGANVLDIGAFIGDTALYFALKGARKIIAYEPVPPTFKIAEKNVSLNNYESVIDLSREAIGTEKGTLRINYLPEWSGRSSFNQLSEKTIPFDVNVKPLSDAIDELGFVDLLKMDCEGAEWEITKVAVKNGWLGNVGKVILEVHGGNIDIMRKLFEKANFRIAMIKRYSFDLWLLMAIKD